MTLLKFLIEEANEDALVGFHNLKTDPLLKKDQSEMLNTLEKSL